MIRYQCTFAGTSIYPINTESSDCQPFFVHYLDECHYAVRLFFKVETTAMIEVRRGFTRERTSGSRSAGSAFSFPTGAVWLFCLARRCLPQWQPMQEILKIGYYSMIQDHFANFFLHLARRLASSRTWWIGS